MSEVLILKKTRALCHQNLDHAFYFLDIDMPNAARLFFDFALINGEVVEKATGLNPISTYLVKPSLLENIIPGNLF